MEAVKKKFSIKKLFEPSDMTVGTPWKSIGAFAIPMIIGNIAQQLYSTVDSIVVGYYNGDNALAAIIAAFPLVNLLLALFIGISAGVGIMVAQYFGAKSREDLSDTIGSCITLTAIVSVFFMVAIPPFVEGILRLFNTPESILKDCTGYLVITLYGIVGMAYYNILCGILRGMGDSFSPLIYLLIATVINIVLDIYFVAELNMGVPGVALATVIAQAISSVLCFFKLMKMKSVFDLGVKQLKMSKFHIKRIISLGLPSGATQAIMSSAMLVVQALTNSFGETFITANGIVMRVDGFAMMPNFSFGTAMTTYAGQNIGARKIDRIHKGAKQGTLMAVGCSTCITVVILVFGKQLMGLFTKTTEIIDMSYHIMSILAVGYIAVAVTQSFSGVMRGVGDTMTPMWISLIQTIVIRVPLAYGIAYFTKSAVKPNGIEECIPVSLLCAWLIGATLTTIFYKFGSWKKKLKVME